MKTCINCKIEFTKKLTRKTTDFCTFMCEKAYKEKWLEKLYKKNDNFLKELLEKNLRENY